MNPFKISELEYKENFGEKKNFLKSLIFQLFKGSDYPSKIEDTVYLMKGCKEVFDICMICKDYTKMVYKLTPEESEGIFSRTGCYGTSRYQNKMLNELWEGSIDIKSNKETFGIVYQFEFKQRPYKGKEIRVRKIDLTKV